jgi:hypothetical protein
LISPLARRQLWQPPGEPVTICFISSRLFISVTKYSARNPGARSRRKSKVVVRKPSAGKEQHGKSKSHEPANETKSRHPCESGGFAQTFYLRPD